MNFARELEVLDVSRGNSCIAGASDACDHPGLWISRGTSSLTVAAASSSATRFGPGEPAIDWKERDGCFAFEPGSPQDGTRPEEGLAGAPRWPMLVRLPNFTMIGATTEEDLLPAPLISRFEPRECLEF